MGISGKKILIVGLGLIGGSYARGLRAAGFEVGALARREETARYALGHGFVDSVETEVRKEYVSRFDIVVFCLYPTALVEWIGKWQDCFKPGALITDVSGIKVPVVYPVQKMLRADLEFISAHPMAGRELSGVEHSDPSIFRNANYLVVPTDANTEDAILKCEEIGRILGFGKISRLSPELHDEMIGFLSQLTHCIAVSLMACKESSHLAEYTGDSFRDLTRIARINDRMWSELFLMNRKELLSQMDLFEGQFLKIRKAVEDGDARTLREIMQLSTERRKYFDK